MSDTTRLIDALAEIGDRHLDEYFEKKEKLTNKRMIPRAIKPAVLIAACLCVIAAVTVGVIAIASRKEDPIAPPDTQGLAPAEQTVQPSTPGEQQTNKGLVVSSSSEEDPGPGVMIVAFTEKSVIKVGEDLTVRLYCLPQFSWNDFGSTQIKATATIKMRESREHDPEKPDYGATIKEIDDFTAPGYQWGGDERQYEDMTAEEVVVPAEVFTEREPPDARYGEKFEKNEGAVCWFLEVYISYPESSESDFYDLDSIALYYRIDGENVYLYATQYDFKNDIRK